MLDIISGIITRWKSNFINGALHTFPIRNMVWPIFYCVHIKVFMNKIDQRRSNFIRLHSCHHMLVKSELYSVTYDYTFLLWFILEFSCYNYRFSFSKYVFSRPLHRLRRIVKGSCLKFTYFSKLEKWLTRLDMSWHLLFS